MDKHLVWAGRTLPFHPMKREALVRGISHARPWAMARPLDIPVTWKSSYAAIRDRNKICLHSEAICMLPDMLINFMIVCLLFNFVHEQYLILITGMTRTKYIESHSYLSWQL